MPGTIATAQRSAPWGTGTNFLSGDDRKNLAVLLGEVGGRPEALAAARRRWPPPRSAVDLYREQIPANPDLYGPAGERAEALRASMPTTTNNKHARVAADTGPAEAIAPIHLRGRLDATPPSRMCPPRMT
jgi:hypothetical protein